MGIGGIGIWQLLIILVIVLLIFGPNRLKNLGSQLGGAIRDFRKSVKDGDGAAADASEHDAPRLAEKESDATQQRTSEKDKDRT